MIYCVYFLHRGERFTLKSKYFQPKPDKVGMVKGDAGL